MKTRFKILACHGYVVVQFGQFRVPIGCDFQALLNQAFNTAQHIEKGESGEDTYEVLFDEDIDERTNGIKESGAGDG